MHTLVQILKKYVIIKILHSLTCLKIKIKIKMEIKFENKKNILLGAVSILALVLMVVGVYLIQKNRELKKTQILQQQEQSEVLSSEDENRIRELETLLGQESAEKQNDAVLQQRLEQLKELRKQNDEDKIELTQEQIEQRIKELEDLRKK
jgi:uncharacterized protein HemX